VAQESRQEHGTRCQANKRITAEGKYQPCQSAAVEFDSERFVKLVAEEMDYVSKHFERWEKLADLTSKEQDSAKLTELAHEINLVLALRAPYLDPPLRESLE